MKNVNYDVDILVNGKPQKIHYYQDKYYIEGRVNYEYSIKIKNNSYNKVLVLSSVDGLDTMTGESASDRSGGYILEARSSYDIKGYRKDLNTVGAFKFSSKNQSYAKSKKNGAEINCGIIGIKIFEEKQKEIVCFDTLHVSPSIPYNPFISPYPYWTTYSGLASSSSMADMYNPKCVARSAVNYSNSQDNFTLGSTWGQKVESVVVESTFERGNIVFSQDIYYSTRENLIKMGVPIIKQPKISYPRSFPGKFAEPPSDWGF